MSGILVVLQKRGGRIGPISWEALAAGQQLGKQTGLPVSAVIPGARTESLTSEAATKALARVVRVEHALLGAYTSDGFTIALEQLVQKEHPDYVVFPHTYQ